MARLEASSVTLQRKPFDPMEVCKDSLQMVRHQATKKGLNLSLQGGDGVPTVGDASRLHQALMKCDGGFSLQ